MATENLSIPASFPLDLKAALSSDPDEGERLIRRAKVAVYLYFRNHVRTNDGLADRDTVLYMLGLKQEPSRFEVQEEFVADPRNPDPIKNPFMYWAQYPPCALCGAKGTERKKEEGRWCCANGAACKNRIKIGTPEQRTAYRRKMAEKRN